MRKYLILDKSVFEATSTSKLEKFAQTQFLILPDVLYYECVTTGKNEDQLLGRFRSVILAGACICPGRNVIIQKEAKDLCPYGGLVDLEEMPSVRRTFQENSRPYDSKQVEVAYENERNMAQMIMDLANGFTERLASQQPKLLAEIRKCDGSKAARPVRLVKWAEFVDSQDMHNASKRLLKGITKLPENYCLSANWVTWQFLRLILTLSMERAFLRHSGGTSGIIPIEHDIQDITYVLLLSRADALLTRDETLVKPLAKAAFPDKDVFSDVDEVPDDYLCHWTDD